MNRHAVEPTVLRWNDQGTPVSQKFDDVYFSNQDGLAESRHVFLHGNGLPARLTPHPRPVFRVAETEFSTSLNFLALWHAFDTHCRQQSATGARRLHFISFEKYPLGLGKEDLRSALEPWQTLAPLPEELLSLCPQPVAGYHRLVLAHGRIILDIGFGDVNTLLPALDVSLDNQVDAWFLDGFAPAKNPDMWQDTLFAAMARLAGPEASFPTFTAAGFVRRGLQQAGFAVIKSKASAVSGRCSPAYGRRTATLMPMPVPVLRPSMPPPLGRRARRCGHYRRRDRQRSGRAGTSSARRPCHFLLRRRSTAAGRARAIVRGCSIPLLNHRHDALAQFFAEAFPFALRCYQHLAAQGVASEHQWCGVTQLAWDEKSAGKIARILDAGWPSILVRPLARAAMAALVGVETGRDGLMYPAGGWLNPAQLTAGAMRLAAQQGPQTHYRRRLTALSADDGAGWQLTFACGDDVRHATVVLANGHEMSGLAPTAALPLYAACGQVSHLPATVTGYANLFMLGEG